MNYSNKRLLLLFASILLTLTTALAHEEHEAEEHEKEIKGPHGGKLLIDGDFSLEVTIFEDGVPPEMRIFPYFKSKPIEPSEVKASIKLIRFDREDLISFRPSSSFLISNEIVKEPHSFSVVSDVEYRQENHHWTYDSFEGRTQISSEMLKEAKVEFNTSGPGEISPEVRVYGRLLSNQDKVFHAHPRFSGIIREAPASLGKKVKVGEVIAVIESDQSLQRYEIRSLIEGTVIEKHATLGEHVTESSELFVITDLSEVWADFQAYGNEADEIMEGQQILINLPNVKEPVSGKVVYISPVVDEATQSKLIRAILANTEGHLRPGIFVSGILATKGKSVPLVVLRDAIQTFRNWNVVFLTDGNNFQAMPVELGRQDSKLVEVVSGISAGSRYVSKNSYLIKADIEKSGASHDH
jgi:cobalt-zinc-cadmium efflux system membrane fusion protein